MGELWRSQEMQLVQLVIPAEAAHDTVARLGHAGCVQFKDLNAQKSAFQRTYANQVKRCDEMQRKLRFLYDEMVKADVAHGSAEGRLGGLPGLDDARSAFDLDELEVTLEELENDLCDIGASTGKLKKSKSELVEFQLVLERAGQFFDEARQRASQTGTMDPSSAGGRAIGVQDVSIEAPLINPVQSSSWGGGASEAGSVARLGFIAGLVPHAKVPSFERILFRAMRGNMFLKAAEVGNVMDPALGEKVEKDVFVIFFSGERSRSKILKICDAFNANRYPLPEDHARQLQMHSEVSSRLRELTATIDASEDQSRALLLRVHHDWDGWMGVVRREKAVYHTLNKFSIDVTSKCLVAQGWIPTANRDDVVSALKQAALTANAPVDTIFHQVYTTENPPTYFKTDKVISGFQALVDSYGVARYREMNPAVFTIVTFPFLFAVMFGDIGHGLLMLMFALYFVLNEKKLGAKQMNDMVEMAFGGRYLILLMSVFSIYTGLLYNEYFSIPTTIFGKSHWEWNESEKQYEMSSSTPYPVGVDPIWHGTKTELTFLNSMKMKMSIVLGVIQMVLGVCVSFYNSWEKPTGPQTSERDMLTIYTEFIPRFLFLTCTFGYLAVLIIVKWFTGSMADLYTLMINMFLSPGTQECGKGCPTSDPLYGLGGLAVFLVLVALLSVPVMLLGKPLILRRRHKAKLAGTEYGVLSGSDEDAEDAAGLAGEGGGHGGEEFEFGEMMVHNMIHTIEFVLGGVSNTASYLRLWALSLAHSQLSMVFYEKCMVGTLEMGGTPFIVVGFMIWACATFGVLMIMESLSAFLHALRLHWVEYQNKFYVGDGYQFEPFKF